MPYSLCENASLMTKILHPTHKSGQCRDLLHLLGRRKMLVFGITFFGFTSCALIVQNIAPAYTARAQIMFEATNSSFIETQKIRLGSSNIAQSVIQKLKLMNDRAFNAKAISPQKKSKFKTIDPYETKLASLSNEIIAKDIEPVIARFRNNFSAQMIADSYVVNLEYRAKTPRQAAVILNEIIKHYLKDLTPEVNSKNNDYETKIFQKLKDNAQNAHANLELLKSRIGQLKPRARINRSTRTYERAKAKYARAKAKLQPFLDENGDITFSNESLRGLRSPIMQKLKLTNASLNQKLNALSIDYGLKHPDIISLKSQIEITQKQIRHERANIIAHIKMEHDQAKAQLQSLHVPDERDTKDYDDFMRNKLNMLREQAKEMQLIFDEYNIIYKKSLDTPEKTKKLAQILSQVSVSNIPTFPNKPKILAIGTILSFILGLLITIFVESTRHGFLSARKLEEYLNIPCYALIPKVKKDKGKLLSSYVIDNPSSTTAEAVRALKLVIKLCAEANDREHKVITLTSSLPNEGKTTLSSWIAQLAAKSGQRVILIDADLRKPSIHKIFGQQNTLSLVEYLSGKNKLEEVIDTTDPSGLHIIYGRSVPNSALDLVSSEKLEQLLRSLRKAYDLIIIDSPACMAVSDARALEKLSDQLLYVVSWNKTSRKTVHNGISQFTQFKNAQISTVLTNIDLKKHVQLGYGETINYYGSYKECSDSR